jgi:asparagine synthase (glutamine-hydrolysing)
MLRYLVLMWDPRNSRAGQSADLIASRLRVAQPTWHATYQSLATIVFHTNTGNLKSDAHLLADDKGVVLGAVFERASGQRIATFDDSATAAILSTEGRQLVDHYWGSYVAILNSSHALRTLVLRDPSASLPCFYTKVGDLGVFFSHYDDCSRFASAKHSINWNNLAAYLVGGEHLSRECGFKHVEDIPGGEAVVFTEGEVTRATLWHPVQFCRKDGLDRDELDRPETAAIALRSTVQSVVDAWATSYDNILLRLSGGLDSSLVALCLAASPKKPQVTCLNFFMGITEQDDPIILPTKNNADVRRARKMMCNSDEREYARLAARRAGFDLIERERRYTDIDLKRAWDAPFAVRPSKYNFVADQDDVDCEIVKRVGADALFSGNGGDAVFNCTQRPIGAIDYAYTHPFGAGVFKQVSESAALSGDSLWSVFGKAISHGYFRRAMSPPVDVFGLPHLLTHDAHDAVRSNYLQHPWNSPEEQVAPGKQAQIRNMVAGALYYPFVFYSEKYVTSVNPLTSQPILELCLRIPSYILLKGGISRGLARSAFADILPHEIRRRTVKGVFATLEQQALRNSMDLVRERLIEGMLVREGILDRRRLIEYLGKDQPFLTVSPAHMMFYISAEAWLSKSISYQQRVAA